MKRKSFTTIFSLILLAFQLACGQSQTVSPNSNSEQNKPISSDKRIENLKRQADEFVRGSLDGNLETVSKFIYYPQIIADRDTPAKVKDYRERNAKKVIEGVGQIKSQGIDFKFNVEKPREIVNVDNQLFSVVPISRTLKANEKQCEGKLYLLGISQNNGDAWEFFLADNSFHKTFEFFFTKAAQKIKLPDVPESNCFEN